MALALAPAPEPENPAPPGLPALLTAEDVADRLGVSKWWVWDQARHGRIPHVRLGEGRGVVRFPADALARWIAGQTLCAECGTKEAA